MNDYQIEEVCRSYLGMGIQHWGQSAEQRENATRKYVEAAGLQFGTNEANEWLLSVNKNLRRGKFESEIAQLVTALESRRDKAA